MPNKIIEAESLHKSYRIDGRELPVLRGIDISLEPASTTVVVGRSGAGKSTLLHIVGLLDRPQSGRLLFYGQDTAAMSDRERAHIRLSKIGFVFQFHHLLPEFTARENVLLPGLMTGMPREECDGRAAELLGQVGLGDRLDHKPGELSGGEQQRVALARALFNRPQLILADEPTGNLDSVNSERMWELLGEICRRQQAALLLVTHNEALVRMAEQVFSMQDGRLTRVTQVA